MALVLSAEEIDRYHKDGYVVPASRLSDASLAKLVEAYDQLGRAHPEISLDFVPSPHVPNYVPGLVDCQPWLDFAYAPEVLDAVEDLIGGDFLMWGSAIFGKPANDGKETPMHQDGEYWPIKPRASVTVWIAIDHSTRENGCLRVVPGSHQSKALYKHRRDDDGAYTLNQVINDEAVDSRDAVDIQLEPGQFSIHDVHLVHGSRPNQSGQRRAGLTYRYMPTTSHFDHEYAGEMTRTMGTTDMSDRVLYLMRGVDRCGRNNFDAGAQDRLTPTSG